MWGNQSRGVWGKSRMKRGRGKKRVTVYGRETSLEEWEIAGGRRRSEDGKGLQAGVDGKGRERGGVEVRGGERGGSWDRGRG